MVVAVPQRGEKKELVDHAHQNAREALGRKMAESASQAKLLGELAEAFDLDTPPQRIEVYDNSHIQGAHAVGAMIVAGPEGYEKSQYRKFNIKSDSLTPGDDFGMMKEVLTRRFARLIKEDPDRTGGMWPDLVLIDGGAGQVSASMEVLAELGIENVALYGVAKGTDRDAGKEEFHPPEGRAFALPFRSPALYFVQKDAGRGAPVCHRRPPGQAGQGRRRDAAGRGARHRPRPQTRAAGAFRVRQGRVARRACGSEERGRHLGEHGRDDLRVLSRRPLKLG